MDSMILLNQRYSEALAYMKENDIRVDLIYLDLLHLEVISRLQIESLFDSLLEVLNPTGTILVNTPLKPLVKLIDVKEKLFKYEWIIEKSTHTNALNCNYRPLESHSYVGVFSRCGGSSSSGVKMKYNPQKTKGEPYSLKRGSMCKAWTGASIDHTTINNTGDRYPLSIQRFDSDNFGIGTQQRPVALLDYFIQTYTDRKERVLDLSMKSGGSGIACKVLERFYIGVEEDKTTFRKAKKTIKNYPIRANLLAKLLHYKEKL